MRPRRGGARAQREGPRAQRADTRARRAVAWGVIPALPVVVHLAVAMLAVLDIARLGWITQSWFDLTSVSLMIASAAAGLVAAGLVAVRAVGERRRLRRLLRERREPLPAPLRQAADALDLAASIDVVATGELLAFTYRLRRPRILLSTGLLAALSAGELTAVLAHEHCHLRGRDPLRLLAARLLAGYAWLLPSVAGHARRTAHRLELAADRAAVAHAGRAQVAAALLKVADAPVPAGALSPDPAMGADRRDRGDSLRARIDQLEGATPRRDGARRRLAAVSGATTMGGVLILAAAATCCVGLSQAVPGGVIA